MEHKSFYFVNLSVYFNIINVFFLLGYEKALFYQFNLFIK